MRYSPISLLRRLDDDLDDDLRHFKLGPHAGENKEGKKRHQKFVLYLLSVATHAIGLKASRSPLNSSEDHMLAYVIDMFSLNDEKLERLFQAGEQSNSKGNMRRLHSWRPELSVELQPPVGLPNTQVKPQDLYVRIYIFKRLKDILETNTAAEKDKADIKSLMFKRIFRSRKVDATVLIRPIKGIRGLLRFEPTNAGNSRAIFGKLFKMIQIPVDSGKKQENQDLRLKIRRYQCDTDQDYILRFEFWGRIKSIETSLSQRYRRFVRRILARKLFSYIEQDSLNMSTVNQEFLGYTHVELARLPSYPTSQTYPIFNLRGQRLSKCEISLNIMNRRVELDIDPRNLEEREQKRKAGELSSQTPKRSGLEYLVNHVRLYVDCILYQFLTLRFGYNPREMLMNIQSSPDVSLDNIFFLPAHTLINQHRLQSNLNQLEDLSLRRVSMLMLLVKLDHLYFLEKAGSKQLSNLLLLQTLLTTILQNEYIRSRQAISERTVQDNDISPIQGQVQSRPLIVETEFVALREFCESVLSKRLREWLLESRTYPDNEVRVLTLHHLKLYKSAISYLKKCEKSKSTTSRARFDTDSGLRGPIERTLCEIILGHIQTRLQDIQEATINSPRRPRRIRLQKSEAKRRLTEHTWTQLLNDVKNIDQDLSIHWSRRGLKGLISNQIEFVKEHDMIAKIDAQNMEKLIEANIEEFLKPNVTSN